MLHKVAVSVRQVASASVVSGLRVSGPKIEPGLGTRPKDELNWVRRGQASKSQQPREQAAGIRCTAWCHAHLRGTRVPPQSQLSVVNDRYV